MQLDDDGLSVSKFEGGTVWFNTKTIPYPLVPLLSACITDACLGNCEMEDVINWIKDHPGKWVE